MPVPQLPTELWERIIDDVRDTLDRPSLLACALTCRTFLTRVRWHLYPTVIVRSGSNLTIVANALRTTPILRERVASLIVQVDDPEDDQRWIPLVPLELAPYLTHLRFLNFRGVDFAKVSSHPQFRAAFVMFKTIKHLSLNIYEPGTKTTTSYGDLARLASLTGAMTFLVHSVALPMHEQLVKLTNIRPAIRHPIQSTTLLAFRATLRPIMLVKLLRSFTFTSKSQLLQEVYLSTFWPYSRADVEPNERKAYDYALFHLVAFYEHLYALGPFQNSSTSRARRVVLDLSLPAGAFKCQFILTEDEWCLAQSPAIRKRTLTVIAEIAGWDHEDISVLSWMLSALGNATVPAVHFDIISLRLFTSTLRSYTSDANLPIILPEPNAPPDAASTLPERVVAKWAVLDQVLVRLVTVRSTHAWSMPHGSSGTQLFAPFLPLFPTEIFTEEYSCVVPLLKKLLPKFAAQGEIPECNDMCPFHLHR